ncbi:tyrosine-type recombinase/integrase [Ferrovibrio sp.]|uniref:tyrosine-type recombinase/integrase n=1 Tax=Ferrovibrio sp. TaxID=1917215 RepID=UPI0035AF3AE8
MPKGKITKRAVEALLSGQSLFDTEVRGFGARRQKEAITYFVKTTVKGQQQWITIGRHGSPFTPDTARAEALKLLGQVVQGADPAQARREERLGSTVSDLCDQYYRDALAGNIVTRSGYAKKQSTVYVDKGRIERHIKPLIGRRKVRDLTRADIQRFMNDIAAGKTQKVEKTKQRGKAVVKGGRGTATRTVGLLGGIFQYAVKHGIRLDNPVHGVERHRDNTRDRRLSPEEYVALGQGLMVAELQGMNPRGLAVIRTLAMTGCRKSEIQTLRWPYLDVNGGSVRFPDTKSGKSIRPIGKAAMEVFAAQPREAENDAVFPGERGRFYDGTPKIMGAVRALAGLTDKDDYGYYNVTLHTLRHSFASLANELGYTEATIASMLGHRLGTITSRYIHHLDAALVAAADRVSAHIAGYFYWGVWLVEDETSSH